MSCATCGIRVANESRDDALNFVAKGTRAHLACTCCARDDELCTSDLAPHRIDNLYFYAITTMIQQRPDIVIDVSAVYERWQDAIRCHETQIRSKAYVELVSARARSLGASIGTQYAVAFWLNDALHLPALSSVTLSSRNF